MAPADVHAVVPVSVLDHGGRSLRAGVAQTRRSAGGKESPAVDSVRLGAGADAARRPGRPQRRAVSHARRPGALIAATADDRGVATTR